MHLNMHMLTHTSTFPKYQVKSNQITSYITAYHVKTNTSTFLYTMGQNFVHISVDVSS